MQSITDREKLNFQNIVRKYFSFLETMYNLKYEYGDTYQVKYKSSIVYANIYHDRISYEVNLIIGMIDCDPELFSITLRDLVNLSGEFNKNSYSGYQASGAENLEKVIKRASELVNKYGKDALHGDMDYFISAAKKRKNEHLKATLEFNLYEMEKEAVIQWKFKNYKRVVEIYSPYQKYLNKVQAKRLNYAKKKMQDI